MNRIENDNGYLIIDLAPGETYAETLFDAGGIKQGEITFDSPKAAKEAMDMIAAALCDNGR